MIRINKGIPIPKAKTRSIYPTGKMKIGDMFWVPEDAGTEPKAICGNANARLAPKRFEWRIVGERTGIWRVR